MTARVDFEDWLPHHWVTAQSQGWQLVETGLPCTANWLEIQSVGHLKEDSQAVESFHRAWQRGEDHAILAYRILQYHSAGEFEFWHMAQWPSHDSTVIDQA